MNKANHRPIPHRWMFILLSLLVVLATILFSPQVAMAVPSSPEAIVQQAWEKVQRSNTYTFDTEIEQTTYPVPALSNVGRQPEIDTLFLTGNRDQSQDLLEITVWQNARGDENSGLAVRSENGRTYRRNVNGEWEENDGFTDLFAPDGDPLTFVQTAKNIQPLGIESRQLGELTFQYEKYSFDLDSAAYARVMRQHLREQMAQYGTLPAGITMGTPDIYYQIKGEGFLWLDGNGLPQRLEISLDIPPNGNNGRAVAQIVTDLFNYDMASIDLSNVSILESPRTWFTVRQVDIQTGVWQVVQLTAVLVANLALLLLIAPHWRSRRFYAAVALTLVTSMLTSPLLEGVQASSFLDNMQAAQQERAAQQEEDQAQVDYQAQIAESSWDPHQNPLQTKSATLANLPASINASSTITDTTDTDGDGLIDVDEARFKTCPYLGAPSGCIGVVDPTDSDGDSLSDGMEVHELGTAPTLADTDGDGIEDQVEITPFSYAGKDWYLNPTEEDSNKDGLVDGHECRLRTPIVPADYDPNAVCPDTDSDGEPDVFDTDNDGDGVHDSVDMSPFAASDDYYGEENPLLLSIDNLTLDEPVFVDLQFRPETTTNLNLYNHVLDWPTLDTEGQIQRFLDTTFANTDNLAIRSNSDNAPNGDIRLVPMLEITIPYTDGHYANLPVTPTAPLNRVLGDPVDNWIDTGPLDPFGISVNDVLNDAGSLNVYVPLTQVTDKFGTPQAFSARMLYQPEQGSGGRADWGAAQEIRLVWQVQMITDQCPDGYEDVREEDNGTMSYSCVDPDTQSTAARQDVLTIGHIYPETWQLTGLTVSEEHDFDMAILYEDPALDSDLTADDQMFVASWNLNTGFMIGRDCETMDGNGNCVGNGSRDVTVENLDLTVPGWFTTSSYIEVDTYLNYEHSGYLAYVIGTEVEPLLDTTFGAYTDTYPLIMYAQDKTNRELNLDTLTGNNPGLITLAGDSLDMNLSPAEVDVQVKSSISWTPYQYVDGSWRAAEIDSYLTHLDDRLQEDAFFQPADDSDAAEASAADMRLWVQTYFASLWMGLTAWTELANQPLNAHGANPNIQDADYDPFFTPGTEFGATLIALKFFELVGASLTNFSLASVSWSSVAGFAVLVLVTWAAIALLASGNEKLQRTGEIILASLSVIIGLIQVVRALIAFSNAGTLASISNFKAIGPAGLVISLLVIWGFFLYEVLSKDMSLLAINVALSVAIATTIYTVFLFVLSAMGLGVLGIILFIIDAIFLLLGKKGPTEYMIEAMSSFLFDIDVSVTNLDSSDRLDIQLHDVGFGDERKGFRETNSLYVTMGITNTIKYHRDLADDESRVAKRNVFTYTLQLGTQTFESGLGYWDDTATDQWTPLSGRQLQTSYENSLNVPLSIAGAGVNMPLALNYTESFLSGAQTCWNIPTNYGVVQTFCKWKQFRDAVHYPLSDMLVFDIFPATVAEFAEMNWSSNNTLELPEQVDIDGDTLPDASGTDPSGEFDSDKDGLSDLFEHTRGYNPWLADTDFDGLNDIDELYYGTDPLLQDTDGDGLNDRIETVEGWIVLYNGNQRKRVWSDPNEVDIDADGLSDLEEFIFGFHPNVATDPSLITTLVQFEDLGVIELDAPQVLLQFEDAANSTAFYDSSGEGHHATCANLTICPTVVANGRYQQALQFDGVDDFLTIPNTNDINLGIHPEYTISVWFQVDDATINSRKQVVYEQGGVNRGLNLYVYNGQLYGGGWNVPDSGWAGSFINTPISSGEWHHAVLVLDGGETVAPNSLTMYLDDQLIGTADGSQLWGHADNIGIGALYVNTKFHDGNVMVDGDYFAGRIDELLVVNRAVSAGEVTDLMNGRYNPNDNLLAPDTTLQYQATVTNTSVNTATGFLVGDSSYFDPPLRNPVAAYSFEPERRLRYFANNSGDENPVVCIDNGTCPAIINSVYEQGLWFNGNNHIAYLPAMSVRTEVNSFNLSFWVNLDAYPAPGERMMLFDTDSDEPGSIDIYVNSSGNIVVDVAGHPDGPSVDSRVLNLNNNHISLSGHFQLFINGTPQFLNNWGTAPPDSYQLGPGTLGNSLDASDPFYGQIDELVYYDTFRDTTQVGTTQGGNYNGSIALYRFRYDTVSHGYDNLANDVRAATCPGFAGCPSKTGGRYGSGIQLDGVDDYLSLDTPVDPAVEPFTAALWFRVDDYSNEPIFLQQANGTGTGRTWLGIRPDGRLYTFLGGNYLNGTTTMSTGTWYHGAVTYDGTTLRLYLNGVEEASQVRTMEASDGMIELGRHPTIAGRYFTGRLDELVVLPTAVNPSKIQLLMNSSWPMIDVLDDFIPYSALSLSNQFVSGLAPVSPFATSSVHRFDQEVEAALELQTAINYPIVDPYASDLQVFIPFEDGPGSQVVDNLIPYPNPGHPPDREAYCLKAAHCPTLGLRGQVERAAYFDGQDDYLFLDTNIPGGYGPSNIKTISAWVNAERGTILDLRIYSSSFFISLGMDGLAIFDGSTNYSIPIDLPRNEWFHLAVTIDDSDVGRVYVNGVEVASGPAVYFNPFQPAWGYIGSSQHGNNLLQGYLDDLRMYDATLSPADVVNLYQTSAPLMRFEFDEDEEATVFIDNSVNQYLGQPRVEACAVLTLDTVTVNGLTTPPATVSVDLDDSRLTQLPGLAASDVLSPAVQSLVCGQQTLTLGVVVSGSVAFTGTAVLDSDVPGSGNQTFTSGGDSVTLDWTVGSEPVNQPSPAPGTAGRINNGAVFDGQSFIQIDDADVPSALTNDFTIMAWLRPQSVGSTPIRLFGAGNDASVNGYTLSLINGKLTLDTNGIKQYISNITIKPDLWQHVAVVFDSSNDAHFYLNGQLVDTVTGTLPANVNTDDPMFIGARQNVSGVMIEHYTGVIDELAVYGRSLTTAELFGIYLRELRWYRDKETTYLTIDTDAPTIDLLSDVAYWPDGYIQLAVATTDATSGVSLLDFGLKEPGATDFTWQGAPTCAETDSNSAWCPYFDSSLLGGEGAYEMQFRAVDSVGNETLSAVYTLYVDGTAPDVTGLPTYDGRLWDADSVGDRHWQISLTGSINDPALVSVPPVAGSGVKTKSVRVLLVDNIGGQASEEPQHATVVGSTWSIDYQFTGSAPEGTFTIMVSGADNVRNRETTAVGTISLDESPPSVSWHSWQLPQLAISQTTNLSGTAVELPNYGDNLIGHHFEEPVGATEFYNTSNSQYYTPTTSTCGNCPQTGVPALFGSGVQFDGIDDQINIPFVLNPGVETFAASIWFKPTDLSTIRTILQQLDGGGVGRTWLGIQNSGVLYTVLGGSALNGHTLVSLNEWHHAAVSYDGEMVRLYLDGQLEASETRTLENSGGDLRLGVSKTGTARFVGMMDEFVLYNRPLEQPEVYALAQTSSSGISAVQVALVPQDFISNTLDSPIQASLAITNWVSVTLNVTGTNSTGWLYSLPNDLEGFYEIYLRSLDGYGNTERSNLVWRGLIDRVDPTIIASGQHIGGGTAAQTEYTFTLSDFILDPDSYSLPCVDGALVSLTYNDPNLPQNGLPYEVTATCRVPGHEASRDLTTCDSVGHCTTVTVNPITAPDTESVAILSPLSGAQISTSATLISGGAFDPDEIITLTVYVDGNLLDTIVPGPSITDTPWSTVWDPVSPGTYTLLVEMEDALGNILTDSIDVTVVDSVPTAITFGQLTSSSGNAESVYLLSLALLLLLLSGFVLNRRRRI